MKKYLTLSFILLSSLLFSACSLQKKSISEESTSDSTANNSTFSLRQLISQNIPQKCTYSGSNQEGSFESEIIINGKKFNQIITYKSAEGEEKINSISDGEYVYTWGKHSTNGAFAIKLKADFDTSDTNSDKDDSSQDIADSQVDLDTDYQGKCLPTVVSDADFQPPKDVKFEDYSQFLEDIKSSIPSIDPTDLE